MNRDQGRHVLGILAGNWPNPALTDPQVEVWLRHLDDVNFEIAVDVAHRLIETSESKFLPPYGEFRNLCRAEQRRRETQSSEQRGLPEPALDVPAWKQEGKSRVDEARERLRSTSTKFADVLALPDATLPAGWSPPALHEGDEAPFADPPPKPLGKRVENEPEEVPPPVDAP